VSELVVSVRLRADGSGLVGEIRTSGKELDAFRGKARDTSEDLDRIGAGARRAGGELASFAKGLAATMAAGLSIRGVLQATIAQQQATAQLDAVLRSTGSAAGYNADELRRMASELQRVTTFGDEAIVAAQVRLLSYTGVVGSNFPRALQAVLDQSARLNIGLNESAELIGRALESPAKAAEALSRQGFASAFTDEVKRSIDSLIAQGREAEAQILVLGILEESYAGAAEAAAGTFGGALTQLKNAVGDLLEGQGGSLSAATVQVRELTAVLQDPQTAEGLQQLSSGVIRLVGVLAQAATGVANLGIGVGEAVARAQGYLVPEAELERLRRLRDFARETQNDFEVIARSRQIDTLSSQFPEVLLIRTEAVGAAVAGVRLQIEQLVNGPAGSDLPLVLREAGDQALYLANGQQQLASASAGATELIDVQVRALREQLALMQAGASAEDAALRVRLQANGTTLTAIEQIITLNREIRTLTEARQAQAAAERQQGVASRRAQERLDQQREELSLLIRQNELMREGRSLEEARFVAAFEQADALTQALLIQQQVQQGMVTGARNAEAALKSASEEARRLQVDADQALDRFLNADTFASLGATLREAFQAPGAALGSLIDGMQTLVKIEEEAARTRAELARDGSRDSAQRAAEELKIAEKIQRANISAYASITGAAKGFFKEGSKGYKALTAAEQTFRTVELALAAQSLATKLFGIEASTAAAVASVPTVVAAEGAKASASGVASVASAGVGVPYPYNLLAIASTAALLVGFGVALRSGGSGGGGFQPNLGLGQGTVLGDPTAISQSIANSSAITADAVERIVGINTQMLSTLRSLQFSINGLGNLVVRSGAAGAASAGFDGRRDGRLGSVLGITGAIDGGIGGLAGLSSSSFVSTLGTILDPIGRLIGGLASGVDRVFEGLFGGGRSIRGEGLRIGAATFAEYLEGIVVDSFTLIRRSGGLLGGSSYRTEFAAPPDEIGRQFSLVFGEMANSIISAASIIGVDESRIRATFSDLRLTEIRIDTQGKTGEQISEAISNALSAIFDTVSLAALPELSRFAQAGEGAGETLVRLATQINIMDAALDGLGITLRQTLPQQGDLDKLLRLGPVTAAQRLEIADSLAQMAGGVDQFAANVGGFLDFALTDSQKLALRGEQLSDMFGRLNFALPTSREGVAELVRGLDITTEAGRQAFTVITAAEPLLREYFRELERGTDDFGEAVRRLRQDIERDIAGLLGQSLAAFDLTRSLMALISAGDTESQLAAAAQLRDALIDTYNEQLQAIEQARRDEIGLLNLQHAAAREAARAYQDQLRVAGTLRQYLAELNRSSLIGTPLTQVTAGLGQFRQLAEQAYAGDVEAARQLQTVARDLLSAGQAAYASGPLFQQLYAEVVATLETVAASLTADPRSDAERALENIESQLAQLNASFDLQIDLLRRETVTQLRALLDFAESGGSLLGQLLAAISALPGALAGMIGNNNFETAVRSLNEADRQQLLSHITSQLNAAGLIFDKMFRSGEALVEELLKRAALLPSLGGIPGFAAGGWHSGGLRIVGERGPELEWTGPSRIFPAEQLQRVMAGGDQRAVVAALREQLKQLGEQNRHLTALIRVQQAGWSRTLEQGDRQLRNTEATARAARMATAA
jgi:hypothetical protein